MQPGRRTKSSFTKRLCHMAVNFQVRFFGKKEAEMPLPHPIGSGITEGERFYVASHESFTIGIVSRTISFRDNSAKTCIGCKKIFYA